MRPMRIANILLTLVTLPIFAGTAVQIDSFARKALDVIGAPPGLTIAVVQGDQVVYRGDFGLRDVEAKLPVTPDTRFYVASTTKAFTAMTALVLAEEGKLDLDAPITTYWPALKLTPPLDAERMSIRDFLAMRPGLQNDTFSFRRTVIANIPNENERLRILATYSSARPRTFQYNNMSYEFAAELMERATGKTWQDLTREKVFAPLGMTSATSEVPPENIPRVKLYRSTAAGVFKQNAGKTNASMGPAGGTFITSKDAARWMIAMLNDGLLEGKQVLPKRAVRTAQSAQTMQKRKFRWFDRSAWGIGQDLGEYEGELLVHRFGAFNGAYSHVSWMPDHRIGVAVFSNGGAAAADTIASYAYDLLLGRENLEMKWSAKLMQLADEAAKQRDENNKAAALAQTRGATARPIGTYAGSYDSDRLGRMSLEVDKGRLFGKLGILRAELIPRGGDEFSVDWRDGGEFEPIKFVVDPDGRITGIDWDGRPFQRMN